MKTYQNEGLKSCQENQIAKTELMFVYANISSVLDISSSRSTNYRYALRLSRNQMIRNIVKKHVPVMDLS